MGRGGEAGGEAGEKSSFGLAVSHSPMWSTPLDEWHLYEDKDRRIARLPDMGLLGTDGEYHAYEELEGQAASRMARELTPETFAKRYHACQAAIRRSGEALEAAAPDVAVII